MHINAATLLNLVQLSVAVASISTGLIGKLSRAPSGPLVLHGRKLSQVSVSTVAELTAATHTSATPRCAPEPETDRKRVWQCSKGEANCAIGHALPQPHPSSSKLRSSVGSVGWPPQRAHSFLAQMPSPPPSVQQRSFSLSPNKPPQHPRGGDGASWMVVAATNKSTCKCCYVQTCRLGVTQPASSTHPMAAHVLMRPPGNNQTRRSALTRRCVGDDWPAEVLHLQRVLVVRASDIVAKLVGVLGLDAAARVAAAQADLPTPHAPRTALCEDVVFGAKEKLRDESSTDAILPRGRCRRQRTAPGGTDVLHVVRVVHVQPGQRCAALGARDVPQVDPRAIGARRAVELPLATKLARRGRQRAEELCLVLSLGVPDEGGPVRLPEALAHPAPVPDAGLGLCEQRAPPLGRALAAHALHCCARRAGMWCAPTETEERQRLSTLHGRGLHAQAHGILLAFRSVCIWNAAFCFFVFAFVLCGAVLGLALDCIGLFTSGCADRVSRLLLLDASDVDRHDACPSVQKLLTVLVSAFAAASIGPFSHRAHSFCSSTAPRCSNASSKRVGLHVTCLIILAGFGSCGALSSGPPSAPGTMVVSTNMKRTTSDVALHGRHLNEVSASTVGEFTAAIADSSINKILLAAGTYELTSGTCNQYSAVCIDRALTIEAQVPGSVVLNAMGARRVFEIQYGGTAELIGLDITGGGGSASSVQSVCLLNLLPRRFLHRPAGVLTVAICLRGRT